MAPDQPLCLCLDAEFVEGDELIELSIFSHDRTQLYHSYFKPQRYKRWDSSIHHITPSMVADAPTFDSCRREIQQILDSADYLIGFAVENDTSHLSRQGITGLDDKQILELRNWYWINHGLERGQDLYQGVSLASVAEALDVDFGEDGMHSASGDTMATLECFLILLERFKSGCAAACEDFKAVVAAFEALYAEKKDEYDRTHAEGYAFLLRCKPEGYMLKVRVSPPEQNSRLVASIKVADRKRAEVELRSRMARRPLVGKEIYKLLPKDIEEFKAYSNGFDSEDHALFNKLSKLSGRFNVSSLKRR